MLFESEAKAVNFINFNADDMAAENKGVPVRAYFCAACGGWHITKHDNADWFKAKEVSQNVILTYQAELKIIITDFFTNYSNKQDFEVWKVKMDKALELYDKLQELEVHNEVMVKAGRCFKQFQVNLARKKKKAMAQATEVYLAPVRVLAEKLEAEILDFNLILAKETAGEMRDKLDEMKGLRVVSDDIARLQGMTDMVLDTELYTLLDGMMEAIKSAQHKVLVAKTVLTKDEMEDLDAKLLAVNESLAIKKTVIKRFRCNIHAVKNGSSARLTRPDNMRMPSASSRAVPCSAKSLRQWKRGTVRRRKTSWMWHISISNGCHTPNPGSSCQLWRTSSKRCFRKGFNCFIFERGRYRIPVGYQHYHKG